MDKKKTCTRNCMILYKRHVVQRSMAQPFDRWDRRLLGVPIWTNFLQQCFTLFSIHLFPLYSSKLCYFAIVHLTIMLVLITLWENYLWYSIFQPPFVDPMPPTPARYYDGPPLPDYPPPMRPNRLEKRSVSLGI